MAWTTPMTFVAGSVLTAANLNTHVRDNTGELRTGGLALSSQAALDFLYASSASQLARLAVGAKYTVPRVNSGASAYEFSAPHWLLASDDTQAAIPSGSEAVLYTYTVAANLLNVTGRAIRITAYGTMAANSNSRTARIRWGGVSGTIASSLNSTDSDTVRWMLSALIVRIGSNSQRVLSLFGAAPDAGAAVILTTASATDSSTIDLVVTGQGSSASDVVYEGAIVEMLG